MSCYIRAVTKYPWLIIVLDILLVLIMGPVSVWYAGLPDFSDPNKGFEPRGTLIQGWNQASVSFTTELLSQNGSLSYFPNQVQRPETRGKTSSRRKRNAQECLEERLEGVAQRIIPQAQLSRMKEAPKASPRMVVEDQSKASLWTANHMHSICAIEKKYVTKRWTNGCPAFSLPYYISALRHKNCDTINEDDMDAVLRLLRNCSFYYSEGLLTDRCYDTSTNRNGTNTCSYIPDECTTYNAPYYIFHFLADNKFLTMNNSFLEYSMIIYRKSWDYDRESMLEHYESDIEQWRFDIRNGSVVVNAMDYYMIFRQVSQMYVLSDIIFYILSMTLVVIVLLLYLRSFSLMIAVLLNVNLSISAAYFLYSVVFQFKYFSFMNCLAGLLLIAVGADDVFILHDIWHKHKLEGPADIKIETLTKYTLRHGLLSILVTSMTTAAALFANGVSSVTALKCFGIFGGVCILVNLFFMITLVPAILVLAERYERRHPNRCQSTCCNACIEKINALGLALWDKIIPCVILKPWFLWLFLFGTIGVGSFVVVFHYPQIQLIQDERIKVFYNSHPFEVYRDKMMGRFNFEIAKKLQNQVNLQLLFLFGVNGEENGNILDPDDRGTLKFDHKFEVYRETSQQWMTQFCRKLLADEYTVSPDSYRCFFDIVQNISESSICQTNSNIPSECCKDIFPLTKTNANICFRDKTFIQSIYRLARENNQSLLGTPVFKHDSNKMVAMTFQIESDFTWTPSQPEMDKYYKRYTKFMNKILKSAPKSLKHGWFSGAYGEEFFFYDLLTSVVEGTISGIALSMGVAFLVMMVTSGNIIITIYSMVTIAFVIGTTVASLVLMGWEFAILESLVILLAVGLSIDFTIHFAVAYKVSHHSERAEKSANAVRVVGSAVTMAGITTFLAGSAICLGRVMSYFRFGVFLMLDMTISWAFALFFFIPLCSIIGPEGSTGDLKPLVVWFLRRCCCCCFKSEPRNELSEPCTRAFNRHLVICGRTKENSETKRVSDNLYSELISATNEKPCNKCDSMFITHIMFEYTQWARQLDVQWTFRCNLNVQLTFELHLMSTDLSDFSCAHSVDTISIMLKGRYFFKDHANVMGVRKTVGTFGCVLFTNKDRALSRGFKKPDDSTIILD